MNLTIVSSAGINVDLELESKMRLKFEALEKIYSRITGFEITMKKFEDSSNDQYVVEGRVLIPKSSFFCRERAKTFEMAVDLVIENLTRQLKWLNEERAEIW